MNFPRHKAIIKLLTVITGTELMIMTGFHVLAGNTTPLPMVLLDVALLGLISTAVTYMWIMRPLDQAREQNAMFRSITEGLDAGLVITDPAQDNTVVYTNAAFSHITGYSKAEMKGKHPRSLNEGLAHQPGQDKIVAAIKSGKAVRAQLQNRRKDGTVFWNDLHLRPIFMDGVAPKFWLGLLHDVSESRALNLQVERMVCAVEQASDMIVLFDQQGCIEFANQALIKQFGSDQLVGQQVWQFWYDQVWTATLVQRALQSDGQWSGRHRWQRANGKPYEAMTSISIVDDNNGEKMYIAVHRDMTDEIEAENKLLHAQKMEAVGTLAGGIAHDFNNMLAAMLGNLYLLKKNMASDSDDFRRIENIEEQGHRGANLIRQMLIFSRKHSVDMHRFDLQLLFKESIKLLQTSTPESIRLNTDIDAASMIVRGDPSMLQSSLFNLVNNARHAIEHMQTSVAIDGLIHVSIHRVDLEDIAPEIRKALMTDNISIHCQCVHISISDNGAGMDKKTQARIFEPYFTTKEVGKGTGLGLSMVMGCVEMHAGWIGLTSAPGKGSCFDIYLPLSDASGEPVEKQHDEAIHPGNGELILLADDNRQLCVSVAETLEDAGYQVIKAFDGEQALQQYMRHKATVQLVILDCVMPKVGGVEVAETIWQHSGGAVKTVLMTGYDMSDSLPQTWSCGEQPLVLQKPWQMKQLNGVLKSLNRSSPR